MIRLRIHTGIWKELHVFPQYTSKQQNACHSSQHVSVANAAIFRVRLLQEYRDTMWVVVLSLHNYYYYHHHHHHHHHIIITYQTKIWNTSSNWTCYFLARQKSLPGKHRNSSTRNISHKIVTVLTFHLLLVATS